MSKAKILSRALTCATMAVAQMSVMAAPLEIAGSTTVEKTIIEPTKAAATAATGVEAKMMPVGSVKGLQMLFEGRVTVAALSDTLEDATAALRKTGFSQVPANAKFTPVFKERLVPIVHPNNSVAALSREQLRDLFTGKLNNWKQVGGPDAPVALVLPARASGTRSSIDREVLGGNAAAATAKEVRTAAAEVGEVARDPNAIGLVGEGTAASGGSKIKEVKGPDIARTLGFVTLGEPAGDASKLIQFWKTPDAQKQFAH